MPQSNRITLALRPREGEILDSLQFYARLGAPVSVGRALGVIVSLSEGDAVERVLESEAQIVLTESALAKSKAMHGPWTDAQCLDFLSVALRHVVVTGDLQYSDINTALKYMADKGRPAFVPQFNVDDHVRMARDAARYQWLRDVAFDTPRQDLAIRDKSGKMLIEQDLDSEIDCAMHAYPVEQDDTLLEGHGEPE